MSDYSWTQPICGGCFSKRASGFEPFKMKEPEPEVCVDCREPTKEGIYIRLNPDEAEFPTRRING